LCLEGWEGDDPRATWQVVASPGSVESDQMPSPVQGVKGTVFQDDAWQLWKLFIWKNMEKNRGSLEVGGWRGVFDFSLQLEMVIFFTFDDLSGP